jgi:methyl-accepting chemotaxis protein
MNNGHVKSRIVLIMVIVILIITIATVAIVSARVVELQNRTLDNVAERLGNNVTMIGMIYDQTMTYSWVLLDAIHALPQVQSVIRGGSREEANAAMNGLFSVNIDVGGFRIYNNFLVFNSQFNTIASANPTPMASARNSPYAGYLLLAERGQKWASNVTISSVTGLAQIWITRPFMDGNTFLGMAAIPLNIQGLNYFLGSLEYETGKYYTVIADGNGLIAYSNRPGYFGKNIVEMGIASSVEQLPQNQMFEYVSTVSGNRDMAHLIIDPDTGWIILNGIDLSSVEATLGEIVTGVLPFVLGLLAVGVVMFLFIFGTLKALERLAITLNNIANGEGDLTAKLPETGVREIADVSRYFNQTIGKIRDMVIIIKKQAGTLSEIGGELANNMNKTAASVNQIAANVQNVKDRIMNQSASVNEAHATMEQLVSHIGRLNTNVDNQGNEITQASTSIEEMVTNIQSVTRTLINNSKNVKNLRDAAEVGRSGLIEVSEDIKEIVRESEGLLEINAVMQNIASQTNLLSMNAAIEAAHAGESGKGFAVVADEIRKLAEDSSEQSKIIVSVLKKIKSSIDKITISTDNVLNRFEEIDSSVKTVADQEDNIRKAMEEQELGSQQLLAGTAKVNGITTQVRAGANEMREGAQEVIRESENLSKTTQEITYGMNDMAQGADQIKVAVNHVNEISNMNRSAIDTLINEVSRFKVED